MDRSRLLFFVLERVCVCVFQYPMLMGFEKPSCVRSKEKLFIYPISFFFFSPSVDLLGGRGRHLWSLDIKGGGGVCACACTCIEVLFFSLAYRAC